MRAIAKWLLYFEQKSFQAKQQHPNGDGRYAFALGDGDLSCISEASLRVSNQRR